MKPKLLQQTAHTCTNWALEISKEKFAGQKFRIGFIKASAFGIINFFKLQIPLVLFLLLIHSYHSKGQVTLIREGIVINNTETGTWYGDNIPRDVPTTSIYRNNSITSVNTEGYIVQAGDDWYGPKNNNLDGEIVTGNKLVWNGVNAPTVITHGLIVGYNINSTVKYNYLDKAPYGIIFKSGNEAGENMTFTSGGCAYNICKNGKFALRMKGINGVKAFNNTFYNGDGSGWYFILITANMDIPLNSPSTGTKIFNNIFYTTTQFPMIKLESDCLKDFESDYNVYWCTVGEPKFMIDGVSVTWDQWRALGYDTHSIIADPQFNDTIDLVPTSRLEYGKNLGVEWQTGLSTSATWVVGISPATADQYGTWQVGARVYKTVIPVKTISVTGDAGANTISSDNGTLQLSAAVLPANASNPSFVWSIVNGTGKATISPTGLITAVDNGIVTAYATANDGSGTIGIFVINISNQTTLSSGTVGNENTNDLRIIVTRNELTIKFNLDFISYKANLYTLQGELVASRTVENDSLSFDISNIPSGIYLVELSKGLNKKVVKVLKPL